MISVATALKPTLIPTAELDLIWFSAGVILGDRGKELGACGRQTKYPHGLVEEK